MPVVHTSIAKQRSANKKRNYKQRTRRGLDYHEPQRRVAFYLKQTVAGKEYKPSQVPGHNGYLLRVADYCRLARRILQSKRNWCVPDDIRNDLAAAIFGRQQSIVWHFGHRQSLRGHQHMIDELIKLQNLLPIEEDEEEDSSDDPDDSSGEDSSSEDSDSEGYSSDEGYSSGEKSFKRRLRRSR